MSRRAYASLVLLLALAAPVRASNPDLPAALWGDDGVATTDDARVFRVNPAGIGQRYPSEWWVAYSRGVTNQEAWTAICTWRRLGFSYVRDASRDQRFGFGFSLGTEQVRLGWTSELRMAASPASERDGDHRVGWLSRPSPWLSLGADVQHLFEPEFRGERFPRTYTLGLGLRPLALSRERAHGAGVKLTLLGEVVMAEGASNESARVRAGLAAEVFPGLELRATAEDHGSFKAGVTLRGARSSLSVAQARLEGDRRYETYSASAHEGEDRVELPTRAQLRVAVVRMGGVLADQRLGGGLLGGPSGARPSATYHEQFERALEDPLTRGVFLQLDGVGGMAQLEELRPRIQRLVLAGKPVVAYMAHGGGRGDLYLASAATRAYAAPAADFVGLGLRTERRYYREALAKLGVKFDRTSIGDFKSAYRNLSADSTPPADTTVIQRMLTQRQELFVDAVTNGRKIPAERLLPVLDGRHYPASALARLGVLDSVAWREQAMAELGQLTGLGRKPRTVDLKSAPRARERWATPQRIAVVYAGGTIVDGRSSTSLYDGAVLGDETFAAQLEAAFRAPDVKAVVLRIESPGGSATASYHMDHTVERLKRETGKPLVVSMGSVAASGGYFMSAHADKIFANKHTVTGSIGVVFVKPSLERLYSKLGVRQEDFERGDYMRGLSPARDWRAREQASADSASRRTYRTFVMRVADGRKLENFEAFAHAQGRAYMGEDALQRNLIDGIGGLDAAITEARRLGGIPAGEKISHLEFRHPRGPWLERLFGGWVREYTARMLALPEFDGAQARVDEWVEEIAD
jgi:protease-4